MKTAISVTAVLMLALSLGGQSNPANAADTKKPNIGPITAVPISVNPDLAIGNVLARCLCTPDLDRVDALFMKNIYVEVINPTTRPFGGPNSPAITVSVTYHDLVTGAVKTLERSMSFSYAPIPSQGRYKVFVPSDALAKRSVGITARLSVPNDTNPSNNSVTINNICTPIVE